VIAQSMAAWQHNENTKGLLRQYSERKRLSRFSQAYLQMELL